MRKITLSLFLPLLLILQACNLPNTTPISDSDGAPATSVAQTLTQLALDQPAIALSQDSITPTITFTSPPQSTATPGFPYVTLSEATNCREGPDTGFAIVDTFIPGQTIEVIGKHSFDNFWYVRSPNNAAVLCWMWGNYASGGNLANVPLFTPPPTLTPLPSATATTNVVIVTLVIKPLITASHINSGKCVGWWSRFSIKNTGGLLVKSISISLKDTVTNKTVNSSANGFQDMSGCVLSAPKASLSAGDSVSVVGPSFTADPTGHTINAAITACTDENQGGSCVTTNFQFVP